MCTARAGTRNPSVTFLKPFLGGDFLSCQHGHSSICVLCLSNNPFGVIFGHLERRVGQPGRWITQPAGKSYVKNIVRGLCRIQGPHQKMETMITKCGRPCALPPGLTTQVTLICRNEETCASFCLPFSLSLSHNEADCQA